MPHDADIRNSTSAIALDVDVRANGGYVVAPPSVLSDGGHYYWESSETGIAEAPQWLVGMILANKKQIKRSTSAKADVQPSLVKVETNAEPPAIPDVAPILVAPMDDEGFLASQALEIPADLPLPDAPDDDDDESWLETCPKSHAQRKPATAEQDPELDRLRAIAKNKGAGWKVDERKNLIIPPDQPEIVSTDLGAEADRYLANHGYTAVDNPSAVDLLLNFGFSVFLLQKEDFAKKENGDYAETGKKPNFRTLPKIRDDETGKDGPSWKPYLNDKIDEQQLIDLLIQFPDSNIAVICDPISGVAVVDCDGIYSLHWAQTYLPFTPLAVRTGKGLHLYYRTPQNMESWRERARNLKAVSGVAVDIQLERSYVVAPGSTHCSVRVYQMYEAVPNAWQAGAVPPLEFIGPYDPGMLKSQSKKASECDFLQKKHIVTDGLRHDALKGYVSCLAAHGMTDRAWLLREARAWYLCQCEGAPDKNEIENIVDWSIKTFPNKRPEGPGKSNKQISSAQQAGQRMKNDDDLVSDQFIIDRFLESHGNDYKYCVDSGLWAKYSEENNRWNFSKKSSYFEDIKETCDSISKDNGLNLSASKIKALHGYNQYSRTEKILQKYVEIQTEINEWDTNPLLLGTPSGIIDLDTGDIIEGKREYYISKSTKYSPAENEDCPRWLKFLEEVTAYDKELIKYLKSMFGYTLTGLIERQELYFLHGQEGGNGKSLMLETISNVMVDYARSASQQLFISQKYEGHSTDLAYLAGARMIEVSELGSKQEWAEEKIKMWTGGDKITARLMRENPFTFEPVGKLWFCGNDIPRVVGSVSAMARRIRVISMDQSFICKPDRQLSKKLVAEGPGILRWMINGWIEFKTDNPNLEIILPEKVDVETTDYFKDQDTVRQWFNYLCDITGDNSNKIEKHELYESYKLFCKNNNYTEKTEYSFVKELNTFQEIRSSNNPHRYGNSGYKYWGIKLKV